MLFVTRKVDFKRDRNALTLSDQKFVDYCNKSNNYSLTKVWELFCHRKYGSTSW